MDTCNSAMLLPPLNPKFAIVPAEKSCELRVRGAGAWLKSHPQARDREQHTANARCVRHRRVKAFLGTAARRTARQSAAIAAFSVALGRIAAEAFASSGR